MNDFSTIFVLICVVCLVATAIGVELWRRKQ